MHATCRRIYRCHIYYTMTELEGKTRGAATHTVEAPSRLTQGADSNEQAYGINARDRSQNIQKSYLLHHDRAGRENPRAATHTVEAPSRLTRDSNEQAYGISYQRPGSCATEVPSRPTLGHRCDLQHALYVDSMSLLARRDQL
jgi:hypothetical protein